MTPPAPFAFGFGAGADFKFQAGNTYGQGLPTCPKSQERQIEDLEVENASLENKLAAALEQMQRLGAERDTAKEAELSARHVVTRLSLEWNKHTQSAVPNPLQQAAMDDYEHIGHLQKQVEELEKTNRQQRIDLTKALSDLTATNGKAEALGHEKKDYESHIDQLRTINENLKAEVEHHKTVAEDVDRTLSKAYADLKTADDKRLALIEAKDRLEADNKDWELQFEDLRKQWEQAQAHIEELEEQQKALEQLDKAHQSLEVDVEQLQGIIAGHERTLIVKDERIAHLETQYQKERQRNLNAADAAAAAAATSPTDEAPPSFSTLADTLQDELDAASEDYEHLEYEDLELSYVTEIADIAPIEPPIRSDYTIDVNEAASISPTRAAVPELTVTISEAGSVVPIRRQINTTSAGVQTDSPAFTTELLRDAMFAISPIAPADPPALATELLHDATFAISPIAPADNPALTTELLQDATFAISPIAPADPPALATELLHDAMFAISPIAPADSPELTTELLHNATFELSPVAPIDIATTTTSTQTEAPLLTSSMIENASIDVSPVEAPRVEQSTASSQTEVPTLTSSVIDNASIAVTPVEARGVEQSTAGCQTAAPKLTSSLVDTASIAVSPIEAEAQKLTSHIVDNATLAISPIDAERKPESSLGDVKVNFAEQPVEAKRESNTTLGDIQVTFEEHPTQARHSKTSTASTAAQTTENRIEIATTPTSPVMVTPKRNRISLLQSVLPFVCLLLAISCLHLYIQLDAWRYANGVGHTYSNSGRTGAFGNGRYLFGFIPIAMDIGDSWWEEQIARYMSMAIKSFEDWAGIDYRPLY